MYKRGLVVIIFAFSVLCACAGPSVRYKKSVLKEMSSGKFESATTTIEKAKKSYGTRDASLYFLDLSIPQNALYLSTQTISLLETAESLQDGLFAQSITQNLGTFAVNDYTKPYHLRYFERAQIYFYKAMTYLSLGDKEGATVEARRAVFYLDKLRENKNKDDAFLQYFSGLIFMSRGAFSDARICFENAKNSYDMQAESGAVLPSATPPADVSDKGALTVFHYNGNVPIVISNKMMFAWHDLFFALDGNSSLQGVDSDILQGAMAGLYGNSITVSIPSLLDIPFEISSSEIFIGNISQGQTVLASNLSYTFKKNFEEELPAITTRMIVRAVTKFILGLQAQKAVSAHDSSAGDLVGSIFSMFSNISETADTRSWFVLPAQIRAKTIFLEQGSYDILLKFYDSTGKVVDQHLWEKVKINKGERTYIYVRTSK